MEESESKIKVLICEDDHDDQYLFKSAILAGTDAVIIDFVRSSDQLIDYLCRNVIAQTDKLPDLIVAGMRQPAFWIEGLKEFFLYRQFRHIPVHVFSMIDNPELRNAVLTAGACSFHRKPSSFQELRICMKRIVDNIR